MYSTTLCKHMPDVKRARACRVGNK